MKVKDLRLKITDKNGESIVIGFNDIYGYEGERLGIFLDVNTDNFITDCVNHNSGYCSKGLDKDFAECEVEIL